MKRPSADSGFSLIEVLVSISLFAFVAAGLAASTVGTIRHNTASRDITAAYTLAQDRIEFFRGLDMTDPAQAAFIVSGGDTCDEQCCTSMSVSCSVTKQKYTRAWTVADGLSTNVKQVTVTVTWSDPTPRRVSTVAYVCTNNTCV